MKKAVLLDFASEVNRGDAIMQEVFYQHCQDTLGVDEISVVSVYGKNQDYDSPKHFDLSSRFNPKIFANLRNSGNKLEGSSRSSKLGNVLNLFVSLLQLLNLLIFRRFVGRPDQSELAKEIREADYVIWNGRNFRNRRGIGELYDILCMSVSPMIAVILGRRPVTIGVSIWPLRMKSSKFILRFVLSKCEFVSCRESESFSYANNVLGLENTRLDPDLSFASMPFNGLKRADDPDMKTMYITLVDWDEDGEQVRQDYINAIGEAIRWGNENEFSVTIVPQVHFQWEDYRALLPELEKFGDFSKLEKSLEHEELLELYRNGSILIATRMHSAIFALSEGCKVLAISYDSGAKWNILTDAGLPKKYLCQMQNVGQVNMPALLRDINNDSAYWQDIVPGYLDNKKKVEAPFLETLRINS
ncbi:polysaccharide pyruvyl transferase family protein [Shimia sp.]|uniref:polysaccharide pyruvyl transferase family protein n=1 Tax=Shimia sp. TaxID=1954381 RepID=UPI003BA9BB79